MSSIEQDAETSREWIVSIGASLLRQAFAYNNIETRLLDKANTVAICAELPDEMVIRLRCFPNVWNLKA